MTFKSSFMAAMRVSVAACALLSVQGVAMAQDAEPSAEERDEVEAADGEFLGTIDIGESTRAIRTDTATAITVIDRSEIEDRQANTIAELLDSVPGVTLINGSTPIGSGINIRGFGANGTYGTDQKVLILIDGATSGSEELYRIGTQLFTDPLLYKRAEVIRGTVGSFEYGSGVVGGVVRLESSDAYDYLGGQTGITLNQNLSGYSNRNGFSTSTTIAAMPSEHFEFLANYSYREGGTQKDGHGDRIENSEFSLPSYLVKGAIHFGADNAHTIEASYSQTETTERDKPYDSFGTSGGAFGNVDRDTTSKTLILGYFYNPIGNDAIDLSLVYTFADQDIDQEYIEGSSPFAPPGGFPVVSADQSYETSKITLKNAARFQTGSIRHHLRAGLEYINKDRLDAESAPGGNDKRMAAFAVDEISLFRGFTITPAARWETSTVKGTLDDGTRVSYTNEALMGGISARYELPFGLAAFGSWARTKSLPILDDLENEIYMMQPEKGETWEAGASFGRIGIFTPDDQFAIKVNYYDTDLTDNTSYSGVLEIYLQGVEIEASYATASGFYADFNGNIVDGKRLLTDGVINDWTNLPANTYQLAIGKRFGKLVDVRWEGVLAEDLNTNGEIAEGYDVHNLRASFSPNVGLFKNFTLRLSVENIFDSYYTPALATRPAPGRNFKGAISLQF
ncbi:TonB-dependent heme/hemoglobin receptor family protein [Novosphingobium indicum]|uniref:TonB-dependent heme/hemoglobin receptor family protein n=1 Tax=Novosphingobium indicum TaxID=462949 RepID=A0ABQ2K119_9SPHN|nr:TonB-dependent receptor plug domain-containing protein [Novosphingobium indicum]GGN60675.1 TonB-dependent heme/hemoglobin receptor family protein [Novosphingobium indicum]